MNTAELRAAIVAAVAALLGAVIGGGFSFLATKLAGDQQRTIQQAQFKKQDAQDQRKLAAAAYGDFLRAFDAYDEVLRPTKDCGSISVTSLSNYPRCLSTSDGEGAAWINLQSAKLKVFLHGSDATNDTASKMADLAGSYRATYNEFTSLQKAYREVSNSGGTGSRGSGSAALRLKNAAEQLQQQAAQQTAGSVALMHDFEVLTCQEINPVPRAGCV
jgi:hypothetical protein